MPDTFEDFLEHNLEIALEKLSAKDSIKKFVESDSGSRIGSASRILNGLPFFKGVQDFEDAIEVAISTDGLLNIWFDAAIIKAYSDLFGEDGKIKNKIQTILKREGVPEALLCHLLIPC